METREKPDISAIFADHARMEQAFRQAIYEAMLRHKRLGEPVYVWRDGQVVRVPPEKIFEE